METLSVKVILCGQFVYSLQMWSTDLYLNVYSVGGDSPDELLTFSLIVSLSSIYFTGALLSCLL